MFKFTLVHWTWTFIFLSLSFLSFKETLVGPTSIFGREGIIVYKCTSHPFNIRNSTPYRFLTDSSETTLSKLNLKSFNSSVKSTLKRNLQNAQYFRTFMLDEWEVHLHFVYNISLPPTCCLQRDLIGVHNNKIFIGGLWVWSLGF